MIDLHCHLLPGIDDGPGTLDEAVELTRAMAVAGTRVAVATPHIDAIHEVDPAALAPAVAELREAVATAGVDLDIRSGGEVSLTRYPDLDESELAAVRLGDGPYLLLESPHTLMAGDFDRFIEHLAQRDVAILLAHPERCPTFQRDPERLARLVDAGVLCQITAGSLSGRFGADIRKLSLDLVRRKLVHVVASDAHNTDRRPPGLSEWIGDVERELPGIHDGLGQWLTEAAPAAVLAGDPPPPRPELAPPPPAMPRRGFLGWAARRSVGSRR